MFIQRLVGWNPKDCNIERILSAKFLNLRNLVYCKEGSAEN